MRAVVINHVTLDGVFQGPGAPEEDTRGGFRDGGWAAARSDAMLAQAVGERMSVPGAALLLGRRSYDGMLAGWNERGGPFKHALNRMPKYVASADASKRLRWPNSTLLSGDVPAAVAGIKEQQAGSLVIMGSGCLVRSLMPHGLIDEVLLLVHPVILGAGARLFEPGAQPSTFHTTSSDVSPSGVLVTTYQLAATAPGSCD